MHQEKGSKGMNKLDCTRGKGVRGRLVQDPVLTKRSVYSLLGVSSGGIGGSGHGYNSLVTPAGGSA